MYLLCCCRAVAPAARSLGGAAVEHRCDEGENDVGQPHGEHGGPSGIDGKGGRYRLEQDVGEAQRDAHADARAHAALALLARQAHADERQDEGGEGGGEAFVVLHFKRAHAGCSAQFLAVDELVEFGHCHGFLLSAHVEKVLGLHHDDGVELLSAFQFLAHPFQRADFVLPQCPREAAVGQRIVLNALRREVRHELLVHELVEREAVAALRHVVEVGDIGHHAGVHLHLHVVHRGDVRLLLDVPVLKVHPCHVALRYDIGTEQVGGQGDECRREHIGTEQPPETHARALHGDDFRIVRQLRGEENDGDEHEERTEEVGEVGHEVDVVIEDDFLHGRVALRQLVNLLVEVENHGNHHDDGDEEDVRAQELVDDVVVHASQPGLSSPILLVGVVPLGRAMFGAVLEAE